MAYLNKLKISTQISRSAVKGQDSPISFYTETMGETKANKTIIDQGRNMIRHK